ncbi:MAG: ATP-binding cassette domain-containing protein [Clostridia bacterium]|nr:ATP-binding cassette domain-containing protein [Clostridia bacterium]
MKNALELRQVTFAYGEGAPVLKDLDFCLPYGQFAVLQGVSGTGKSTLLSVINGVIPQIQPGKLSGQILLDGEEVSSWSMARRARKVGSVLQNADDQIVHDRVEDEIAFGCENLGVPSSEMEGRIQEALRLARLKPDQPTRKLSGGQKQRLMMACAFAMGQRTLLLDEPLANLDREGTVRLLRALKQMTAEGMAVLLIEHRLDMVLPYADAVYTLREGRLRREADPQGLMAEVDQILPYDGENLTGKNRLISLKDVDYTLRGVDVLRNVSMDVMEGERLTLLGPNGCGKTTLMKVLARLLYPSAGGYEQHLIRSQRVHPMPEWFQAAGFVFQDPSSQLFMPTLRQEIGRNAKSPERAERMMGLFGLEGLEDRHPQSLSEGQKRRAGIAAICASDPKVLFLDEPTVGQDFDHLRQMVDSLRTLQKESGFAIVTVTHDKRCKEALSDRRIIMKAGRIIR